jgi:hypothetical protein
MKKFHDQVISEILEEKVPQRKGRSNPRGVKRKGNSYDVVKSLGKTQKDEYVYSIENC